MSVQDASFDLSAYLTTEYHALEEVRRDLGEKLLASLAPTIGGPIDYALNAGGKRLRPILCVAAYRAVAGESGRSVVSVEAESSASGSGGAPERGGVPSKAAIYELALALELIHTYSLVHDDLPCMDDDDLRRGRPTTHRVYGVPGAVAAGAALIPLACLTLETGGRKLGLGPAERGQLVRVLCQAAGAAGMVGGQWLDLEAERRNVEIPELEGIHHRKTGALLAAAAELGGRAARADARVVNELQAYGQALGLAFQIADDILDITGDPALLGKTAGRDLTLGKATYPALLGLEGARTRAREEADRAIDALQRVGLDSPPLTALAHYAVERNN
jgi:geranylgeranyl pyrophosphate synthase